MNKRTVRLISIHDVLTAREAHSDPTASRLCAIDESGTAAHRQPTSRRIAARSSASSRRPHIVSLASMRTAGRCPP